MNIHTKALMFATTGVIWFVVAITVLAELFVDPIKNVLASMTGHHWVSKGMLAVILFAAVYGVCTFLVTDSRNDAKPVYVAVGSAVLGGLTIFLFYVWHFLA